MSSEFIKRLLSSIILFPVTFFLIIKGSYLFLIFLIICLFISIYEWHKMSKNKKYNIMGILFLLSSFYSIYQIRNNNEDSYVIFLIIFIICILTDIGGYIFGKILKGPKLTKFSPNKTYSGLLGSYLIPLSSIPIFIYLSFIDYIYLINFIVFVFLVSSVSQFGDITVSYFKRNSNIKDTGTLIPGHGGILDRIDGILFAYPFSYLIMFSNFFSKF